MAPIRVALLVVTAFALGGPARAWAHARTTTFSEVEVADRDVTWSIRVRAADLLQPVGLEESADRAALLGRADQAAAYVAGRLGVREGTDPCLPSVESAAADPAAPEPGVVVRVRFTCPRRVQALALRYDLFFDLDDLHSGFVQVRLLGERVSSTIFRKASRELSIARPVSAWEEAGDYLVLGVEHIFTGYDHLAFLAALLLGAALARRSGTAGPAEAASNRVALASTLKIVTAFTVAHSLTLIGSALRPGLVPTRWVEPVIGLSVAWVGIENLLPFARPHRRWPQAFVFGLVHGFGFASVLREIGLPRVGLVRSLLAFNGGVELGQLAVVAVVLPVLVLAARRGPLRYERFVLKIGSAVLAALGLVWFFLRVLEA